MKLIIDIPEYAYERIREYYEKNDIVESTYSYIYHGTPISDNMTNGEVIKAMFPKIDDNFSNVIDLKLWWNAQYQKGDK